VQMPKKLLIIVNDLYYFVSHRLPIALAARDSSYEVHVAYGELGGVDVGELKKCGLHLHDVPIQRGGTNPIKDLGSVWGLWRLFKKIQPDVLHLVTIKPVIYGGIAARLAKVPAVASAMAGLGFVFIHQAGAKAALIRALFKPMFRWALWNPNQKLIFQNPDDRDAVLSMSGVRNDQARLIRGSGIDLYGCPNEPEPLGIPVITLAARLLRDKGVMEFLEAAKLLKVRSVVAQFWLVGELDLANPSSLTAKELDQIKQEGLVDCLGYQKNVPLLYAKSNIVVLPSYREGLPKSLIEAAACGRAVVTTDVPGCRDAIEPGVTGLLVPPRDAVALADALERLIKDAPNRLAMGMAGRELAEREFGIEKVVEAHLQIYDELLKATA
jgi:glycosyltransferase involved in cell wall biosynthesis